MLVILNASNNDLKIIRKKNKTHKCASHTKSLVNVKNTPKKVKLLKWLTCEPKTMTTKRVAA